jgi:predicted DNA-binding protein YlxM (UPF0122 family)
MSYLPQFVTTEHEEEYYELFDIQLDTFSALLRKVREELFPGYKLDQLTPKSLEVLNDITRSIIYDVNDSFEEKYPQYKQESDIFVPRTHIKETMLEALKEFNED